MLALYAELLGELYALVLDSASRGVDPVPGRVLGTKVVDSIPAGVRGRTHTRTAATTSPLSCASGVRTVRPLVVGEIYTWLHVGPCCVRFSRLANLTY